GLRTSSTCSESGGKAPLPIHPLPWRVRRWCYVHRDCPPASWQVTPGSAGDGILLHWFYSFIFNSVRGCLFPELHASPCVQLVVLFFNLAVGDQSTYTRVGENFQQHSVLNAAINDVGTVNTALDGVQRTANLRQHAAVNGTVSN